MPTRRLIALGAPLVVAAALLRLAAASNEFWLDEVWSIRLVGEVVRATCRSFSLQDSIDSTKQGAST